MSAVSLGYFQFKVLMDDEKDAALVLDEIHAEKRLSADSTTGQHVGFVTLGTSTSGTSVARPTTSTTPHDYLPHSGLPVADKVLVVMLVGLKNRWKEIVAYHYTLKYSASDVSEFIKQILARVHEIGFRVRAIVADMGNHGLWSAITGVRGGTYVSTPESFYIEWLQA